MPPIVKAAMRRFFRGGVRLGFAVVGAVSALAACGDAPRAVRQSIGSAPLPSPTATGDVPFGTDMVPRGQSARTAEEIADVTARWLRDGPDTYRWRIEGFSGGPGEISVQIVADKGGFVHGESSQSPEAEAHTVDAMLARLAAALDAGAYVEAQFDDGAGYPTWIYIEDDAGEVVVNLLTREFDPIDRPEGCAAVPGSATDLSAEPVGRLAHGDGPHRWTDTNGCPVRIDVIEQYAGPEHCGWQDATFLTVGDPIGTPFAGASSRRYFWDPKNVVRQGASTSSSSPVAPGARPETRTTIPVAELPGSAEDTSFRDGNAQLWANGDDPYVVYRVIGDVAERWVSAEPWMVCA